MSRTVEITPAQMAWLKKAIQDGHHAATSVQAKFDTGATPSSPSAHPSRKIIVVDEPSNANRAVGPAPPGAGVDISTAPKAPGNPPPERDRYMNGYKIGQRLRASDGTTYQVDPCGAFRRLTPKPLNKKQRRRQRRSL